MTVRTSVQGAVATLRVVAAAATGTRHAFGPPDGLLRWIQESVEHLTDRTVFAVERIGVHLDLSSRSTFEDDSFSISQREKNTSRTA